MKKRRKKDTHNVINATPNSDVNKKNQVPGLQVFHLLDIPKYFCVLFTYYIWYSFIVPFLFHWVVSCCAVTKPNSMHTYTRACARINYRSNHCTILLRDYSITAKINDIKDVEESSWTPLWSSTFIPKLVPYVVFLSLSSKNEKNIHGWNLVQSLDQISLYFISFSFLFLFHI